MRKFVGAGLLIIGAHAQGQNIVANANFTADTSDWVGSNTSLLAHSATDGGVAQVTGVPAFAVQMEQCVDLTGQPNPTNYAFGASVKPLSATNFLFFNLVWYDGANCTGTFLGQGQDIVNPAVQDVYNTLMDMDVAVPLTAVSARIEIGQQNTSAVILVDNVYLGPNNTPVDLLEFEVD